MTTQWSDGITLQSANSEREPMAPVVATVEPAITAAVQTAPVAERMVADAFRPTPDADTDISAIHSKADRIKRMNELLKNNPNGAQMIENMSTAELTDEIIYQTPPSNRTEASEQAIGRNGNMKGLNSYLFQNVD